jgi:hypothetical protein
MRRHLFVRPARPADSKQFLDWSCATENNEFDPEIPKCPTTITLCAYDKSGPLVYMPLQQPFFMEALAVRPGLSKAETAEALKELTKAAVTQAHILNKQEVYFLGSEPGTNAMAENQLFERLDYTVYRLKIRDTEQ